MKSFQLPVRRAWFVLLLMSYASVTAGDDVAPDEKRADSKQEFGGTELEHKSALEARAKWKAMATLASTAVLNCHQFILFGENGLDPKNIENSPTRDELNGFFHEHICNLGDSEVNSSNLSGLAAKYFENYQGKTNWSWTELRLITDGETLRNDTSFVPRTDDAGFAPLLPHAKRLKEASEMVTVRSTTSEVQYLSTIKQATIRDSSSGSRLTKLQDIVFLPTDSLLQKDTMTTLVALSSDRSRLFTKAFQIEFDSLSAFVHHAEFYSPKGVLKSERRQAQPMDLNGLSFPRISATFHFRSDTQGNPHIILATIVITNVVSLNCPVIADDFKVSAPAGTTVVNLTKENREIINITSVVIDKPVSDVRWP